MNKQKYILAVLLLFGAFCYADDISAQIEAMRESPPRERVEMMNRLKEQIAAMNEEERSSTLQMLQGENANKNYPENRINQNRVMGTRQLQQRGKQPSQPKYQGGRQ